MKKINAFGFCLLFIISGSFVTNAQEFRIYSNEFLNLGAGARALAMGNAYTSITNDASSTYWNPAGLSRIENNMQLFLMHSEHFAGIASYDFGALTTRLSDRGQLGISFVRFGVDDIANTLSLIDSEGRVRYDLVTSFSAVDYAFTASYAHNMANERLRLGGNAKVIHRRVGPFATAWGFGLDAGLQYDINENLTLGFMGRDITSTFNAWSFHFNENDKQVLTQTGNEIPVNSVELTAPKLTSGVNYLWQINDNFTLNSALDVDMHFDGRRNTLINSRIVNMDPKFGIEAGYVDRVFLRAGLMNIQRSTSNDPENWGNNMLNTHPTVGVGVIIGNFALDYAFSNPGQALVPYSHIISIRFGFDPREN